MSPSRPLLVSEHPPLIEDLVRLAAAAGADLDVAAAGAVTPARWRSAPTVLLGAGSAAAAVRRLDNGALCRRSGLVLVGEDLDDAGIWRQAVALGAEHVVFLPDAEPWLADLLAEVVDGPGHGGHVVAVVGGRGGAGASTLAAALAMTGLRTGRRTMLVDADPLGGGIDLILGAEDAAGLRWPDLAQSSGRLRAPDLSEALPGVGDQLTVLSWDRGDALEVPVSAMTSMLSVGRRGSDLVVIDLPRQLDPAAACALTDADVTLLVVPAEVRACAAAARVAAKAAHCCVDLRVVVRGPAPTGLSAQVVADSLGLPLAGWLRPEPGLGAALDRGEPPAERGRGPLARFCQQFLSDLASGWEPVARDRAA